LFLIFTKKHLWGLPHSKFAPVVRNPASSLDK
jgi:hypothetical protein